ncbi:hypothetical protein T459_17184 [Capsicum annuum]|uniref:Vesicle-fusing ATPase n=1 Tax=Capsicum annuum TaxID=4072 RepID=A0A2G2ZAV5_CAPAN|nr:hypothetical protein T459_17184 [Capsicum annuum]
MAAEITLYSGPRSWRIHMVSCISVIDTPPIASSSAMKRDQSDLHVIIFDEIDAICKSRGTTRDGTGVHDSIVNQLLTKIDGVESLNNVLLIGMTNRKDLLDEALMR